MESQYTKKARELVYGYVRNQLEKTDTHVTFLKDDVYVVWFCKTLQNWKALVSTALPDGMYYEVTYDGNKECTYIDAYKKFDNTCVPDGMVFVEGELKAMDTPVVGNDRFANYLAGMQDSSQVA